jgi:D-tyrosyl-tRNA(Tyr) deacylase
MLTNHQESLLILTELTSVFTDEKDAQLIYDIKEKENIIRARHEAKQTEMKNAIKGTSRVPPTLIP